MTGRHLFIFGTYFGVEDSYHRGSPVGIIGGGRRRLFDGCCADFSWGVFHGGGSFLTESSAKYTRTKNQKRASVRGGWSVASYVLAGFIPLAPYVFVTVWRALLVRTCLTRGAFVLGLIGGSLSWKPCVAEYADAYWRYRNHGWRCRRFAFAITKWRARKQWRRQYELRLHPQMRR